MSIRSDPSARATTQSNLGRLRDSRVKSPQQPMYPPAPAIGGAWGHFSP
jgi:hypothetical protein